MPTFKPAYLIHGENHGRIAERRARLRAMAEEGKGGATLASLLPVRQIPSLHPDLPLETALRYVDRWPLVPVVSRADVRQLEGVISQRDALERYREFGES